MRFSKFLCVAAVIALLGTAFSSGVFAAVGNYNKEGHSGNSKEDAYIIDSLEDLELLRDNVNNGTELAGKYYRLESDSIVIEDLGTLGGTTWQAIGMNKGRPFKGHFDGNNNTIRFLNQIDGLFDVIDTDGIAIENLKIVATIYAFVGDGRNAYGFGLARTLKGGTIINCHVLPGSDIGGIRDAGGIVLNMEGGVIRDCSFAGDVRLSRSTQFLYYYSIGGIVGVMYNGSIINCSSLPGTALSANKYQFQNEVPIGGIVGRVSENASVSITNCTSNATIEVQDINILGGIVGLLGSNSSLSLYDNTWPNAYKEVGKNYGIISSTPPVTPPGDNLDPGSSPDPNTNPNPNPNPGPSVGDDPDGRVNNPIIVVPGIMGSRLFPDARQDFSDGRKVWDPTLTSIWGLGGRLDMERNLYIRPCENQNIDINSQNNSNTVYKYGREYGAQKAYKTLIDRLCDEFKLGTSKYRAVYFFSYDWRHSNEYSAKKLNDCIQNVLYETGAKKVNLVCHSMGGIVASRYYKKFGREHVDSIITCGTPFEGAPKLINSVVNGQILGEGLNMNKWDFGKSIADSLLVFSGMSTEIKAAFSGVCELAPTKNYIEHQPMYKIRRGVLLPEVVALTFSEYQEICRDIFLNYDDGYKFQNSLNDEYFNNTLLRYNKSYFILGINQKTIASIILSNHPTISHFFNKVYDTDLKYTNQGDGTVPYYSASICEQLDENNGFDQERVFRYDTDRGGVVKEDDCIKWVIDILNDHPERGLRDRILPSPYIVIRVACPVDVTILNHNGEKLCSSTDDLSIISSFGRLDFLGISDDIKMLCIDDSPDFSVVLKGTDTGTMDFDIRYFNGDDELYREDSFRNIPVTVNTVIKTGTDRSKTTVLEVDIDGDGVVDDYIMAHNSSGSMALMNSSGGCSGGSGAMALMPLVVFIIRRKR